MSLTLLKADGRRNLPERHKKKLASWRRQGTSLENWQQCKPDQQVLGWRPYHRSKWSSAISASGLAGQGMPQRSQKHPRREWINLVDCSQLLLLIAAGWSDFYSQSTRGLECTFGKCWGRLRITISQKSTVERYRHQIALQESLGRTASYTYSYTRIRPAKSASKKNWSSS